MKEAKRLLLGSSSGSEEALIDQINNGFLRTICEDGDFKDANTLLYDLIYGKTTPVIAAAEIMDFARANPDTQPYLENFSMQVLSLACNYPFLQPQLVSLVVSIMQIPPASSPDEVRSCFKKSFATLMGDWASSNYGHLFDNSKHTPGLIRDHIHLHRFIARLLSSLGENENPEHRLTGLNDALFILSTSLEDHSDSHDLPDVDVPAAAQYMIHAGELFFEESNKGSVDFQKKNLDIALLSTSSNPLTCIFRENKKTRTIWNHAHKSFTKPQLFHAVFTVANFCTRKNWSKPCRPEPALGYKREAMVETAGP